jgi:dihydroorotase
MDKFLYLGMPLANVIEATTCRPASILGVSDWLGTIKPGAMADLNCFVVENGAVDLADIHGNVRRADRHLVNRRTIVSGRVMLHAARMPTPPWVRLVDHD